MHTAVFQLASNVKSCCILQLLKSVYATGFRTPEWEMSSPSEQGTTSDLLPRESGTTSVAGVQSKLLVLEGNTRMGA
jgi:hypothetical protein